MFLYTTCKTKFLYPPTPTQNEVLLYPPPLHLLLQLLLDLFKALHIHYSHIEDVHVKLRCGKNISSQNDSIFNIVILLHTCSFITSAHIVSLYPLQDKVFIIPPPPPPPHTHTHTPTPTQNEVLLYPPPLHLLLQLLLDLFKALHIHYSHIEDVHVKLRCGKNISSQNDNIFNLVIL